MLSTGSPPSTPTSEPRPAIGLLDPTSRRRGRRGQSIRRLGRVVGVTLAVGLVAVLFVLAAAGLAVGLAWVARWPVPWATAAVAAAIALGAARIIATDGERARRAGQLGRLRQRRQAAYAGILQLWGRAAAKRPRPPIDPSRLWMLEQEMALLGTTRVLARYGELLDEATDPNADLEPELGRLVAAMRADVLGLREQGDPAMLGRLARG